MSLGISPSRRVVAHAGEHDVVECSIELAVPGAGEPMASDLTGGCRDWRRTGHGCERGFVADSSWVGPADEDLRGDQYSDPEHVEQVRTGLADHGLELSLELVGLGGEELDALGS
jgi:hypothetical protein